MTGAKPGLREFGKVSSKGWDAGVPLEELLARVNQVIAKLLPADDSRINPMFLPRTFRHYVTLGCIDPGRREGRRATYGYRQFLQALLVRKLLSEQVPAQRMPQLLTGRGNAELEQMLISGWDMVARTADGDVEHPASAPGPVEKWNRVRIDAGVELHLSADLPRLKSVELRRLLELIEKALRDVVC